MKNPGDIRFVYAAINLWILRCAQNDFSHFETGVCTSALGWVRAGTDRWNGVIDQCRRSDQT